MSDELALELIARELVTDSFTMYVGYSMRPGMTIPSSGGTARLPEPTNSGMAIAKALVALYHKIVNPKVGSQPTMFCHQQSDRCPC